MDLIFRTVKNIVRFTFIACQKSDKITESKHDRLSAQICMDPIQSLLEAEREAQEIVRSAREERDAIMRQAELDAKAEIQRYADETTQKLQRLEDEIQQSVDAATRDVEAQTGRRTEAFQRRLASRLDEVVDLLTSAVLRVEV
jgi:ATP synthase subunit G